MKRWCIGLLIMLSLTLCGCTAWNQLWDDVACAFKRETKAEVITEAGDIISVSGSAGEDLSEYSREETSVSETVQTVTAAGTADVQPVGERSNKVLVTGDSRTVCLYCSQKYDEAEFPKHIFYNISESDYTGYVDESIFVAKGGEGYSWMQAIAMPLLLSHINEADAVVIWFGVNDLGSCSSYINYVNNLAKQYDVPVYYMTVGPCNGSWSSKNADIIGFNAALQQLLDPDVRIIDAYSYILEGLENGSFATLDGLHYNYNTSRAIYQFMLEHVLG